MEKATDPGWRIARLFSDSANPWMQRGLVLLVCLALFVPTLFRGFMNPDETRYAEIAREMAESGDWVVPRLNYVPFLEKPPLTFWLVAASIKAFGFHPWSVRLAPLLAAVAGILLTLELGAAALGSRRKGLVGALLVATTVEYFILSVSLVTDMVFSAFLLGAWYCFWRFYERGGEGRTWIVLFWAATAVACLAKGPLGLVLSLFPAAVFLVLRGRWRFGFKMRPLLGAAIVCAVNLPWIVALYRRDPRFPAFFYVRMHLAAFRSGGVLHAEPVFYYATTLPSGLFPWSLPAIAALVVGVREIARAGRKEAPGGVLWLLSIALGGLFFLSASKAKLATYTLPLFPAILLILAQYFDRLDPRSLWVRSLVPLQSVVALCALGVAVLEADRHQVEASLGNPLLGAAVALGLVVGGGIVLSSVASLRAKLGTSLLVLGVTAALALPATAVLAPRMATWRTTENLCRRFKKQLAAADLVVVEDSKDYSVPLALGRRVAVMGKARELGIGLWTEARPKEPIPDDPYDLRARDLDTPFLLDTAKLAEVWESDRTVCLIASREFKGRFAFICKNVWTLGEDGETVLVINRRPPPLSPAADAPGKKE